jgi:hypothetical protein
MDSKSDDPSLSKCVIQETLEGLEEDRKALLATAERMARAYGATLYPFDVFANGAVARSLALAKGFRQMIVQRNLVCAGALVRLQLDTALRVTAGWSVDDPHAFAMAVARGERIDRMKDRHGNRLLDKTLVENLAKDHPWVPKVYEVASDFIHLSDRHLARAFELNDDGKRFSICVSSEDPPGLDDSYVEAITYFRKATDLLLHYLEGWVFTKENPDVVSQMKREMERPT